MVAPAGAERRDGPNPPAGEYDDCHRFIFYAVLDGCYESGLDKEDLDLIIPKYEDGGDRDMMVNFVYACPLCHPAFEGFRIYALRQPFHGQKTTVYDTFGQGLDKDTKAKLRAGGNERRTAVQGLITKWVKQRADLLRLNKDERDELAAAIEKKKERGEEMLKSFQSRGGYFGEAYADWKNCPICSGASNFTMGGEKK